MQEIRVQIKTKSFFNDENSFGIFRGELSRGALDQLGAQLQSVTIKGILPTVEPGDVLNAYGDWDNNSIYGRQFVVDHFTKELPKTLDGIRAYLCSGNVVGIGPVTARAIVRKFGLDTLDILDQHPERMIEVEGIGPRRVEILKRTWKEGGELRDLIVFLAGFQISANLAIKVFRKYQSQSMDTLKKNPYLLTSIHGIGFKTADAMALKLGIAHDDPERIRAGVLYVLEFAAQGAGHCFLTGTELVAQVRELLLARDTLIREEMRFLSANETIIVAEDKYYLKSYYMAEQNVARHIAEMALRRVDALPSEVCIDRVEAQLSREYGETFHYDPTQAQAIYTAVRQNVMVLTGGPGTGKTATLRGMIDGFEQLGLTCMLMAPTGRAAKRMSEQTKRPAATIHRALGVQRDGTFAHNADDPLQTQIVIVDEVSMVDIQLMSALLRAMHPSTRLVLVGDVDQLPSVGAGNVLWDIIRSERVPVCRLTEIHRQKDLDSRIVTNAYRINHGQMIDVRGGKQSNFFMYKGDDDQKLLEFIATMYQKNLPQYYQLENPVEDVQILCPMKKGILGVDNINTYIQARCNPVGPQIQYGSKLFRQGDKVIQCSNNYDLDVMNGDIGIIRHVHEENKTIVVSFGGREVEYESSNLSELNLAYAITIHKSQGSEFPVVITPITTHHWIMLQRNLFYTAVTRAKSCFLTVGQMKAVARAIQHEEISQRNTDLSAQIVQYVESRERDQVLLEDR